MPRTPASYKITAVNLYKLKDEGRFDEVDDFIRRHKHRINDRDSYLKHTALQVSVFNNDVAFTQLLLSRGANPNQKDDDNGGLSPLMWAAWKGYYEIAKILIDNGADVNDEDDNNRTALTWSSVSGSSAIAQLLLEQRCDIHHTDNKMWTSLMYSSYNGHLGVTKLLIESGSRINVKNKKGWTAILYACQSGNEDVVQLLIDAGADIKRKKKFVSMPIILKCCKNKGILDLVTTIIAELDERDKQDKVKDTALPDIINIEEKKTQKIKIPKTLINSPTYTIIENEKVVRRPSFLPELAKMRFLPFQNMTFNIPKTENELRVIIRYDNDIENGISGLFVHGFREDSNAEKQGLIKVGDEIISVNGIDMRLKTLIDFLAVMQSSEGGAVQLGVIRRPRNYSLT